jgi:hypothetical protein
MWPRIFRRIGTKFGKITTTGALILIGLAALLAVGIYRLL